MTAPTSRTSVPGTDIDSRYGRTPRRLLRGRRARWGLGGAFALVFAAWLLWASLDNPGAQIEARDTRHSVIDENTVSVTFEVSLPVQTAASCAVQALNESFTVVGWKIIDLPPSDRYTRSFTEVLRTTELANTGLIYRCWLT